MSKKEYICIYRKRSGKIDKVARGVSMFVDTYIVSIMAESVVEAKGVVSDLAVGGTKSVRVVEREVFDKLLSLDGRPMPLL